MKAPLIVIVGPTAIGKSSLAVDFALEFKKRVAGAKVEIISADSRQVYKGLDIGTGKITKREMHGVHHHLLDISRPEKRLSVIDWRVKAIEAIREIRYRGNVPVIVGGTGFYIESLIDNTRFPDVSPNTKLRKTLENKSADQLIKILSSLDPIRTKQIKGNESDAKNCRRIIRAIEIATALKGKDRINSKNKYKADDESIKESNLIMVGLKTDNEILRRKIKVRLDARMKQGLTREALKLHKNGLAWKRMYELGLEYRFLADYLQNKYSKDEMLTKLNAAIWHYARRQMTWFRRDKRIKWFDVKNTKKIIDYLIKMQNKKS